MSLHIDKNKEFLVWNFNFALSTFYEIDTWQVEKLLPQRITPMEAAPGVSLINLTAFNFPKGSLGILPEFQELIFSVIVSPDLSRGVPKFAMHIISLGSSNNKHLKHSSDYYKLPSYPEPLYGIINQDNLTIEYGDSTGKISIMRNCHPDINYHPEERYFQVFSNQNGVTYVADVYIKADLFEHQMSGDTGELYHHPFFRGIDFTHYKPTCFLQMITKPGKLGQQNYYHPERFI